MFEKCINCDRIGNDCVPNLMKLPFPELLLWWNKRQKFLGWTNNKLEEESGIPLGTIVRIKGGDNADCRYHTIRKITIALIGGVTGEFPCKEKMEQELQRMDTLEKQAALSLALEKENIELKARLLEIETIHRQDKSKINEEAQRKIDYLRSEIEYLRIENDRKAKIIDKFLDK